MRLSNSPKLQRCSRCCALRAGALQLSSPREQEEGPAHVIHASIPLAAAEVPTQNCTARSRKRSCAPSKSEVQSSKIQKWFQKLFRLSFLLSSISTSQKYFKHIFTDSFSKAWFLVVIQVKCSIKPPWWLSISILLWHILYQRIVMDECYRNCIYLKRKFIFLTWSLLVQTHTVTADFIYAWERLQNDLALLTDLFAKLQHLWAI